MRPVGIVLRRFIGYPARVNFAGAEAVDQLVPFTNAVDCPGEIYPRRVSDKPTQHYSYWAHEDSLLIEIPVEVIESLQNYPEVATFFGTVTTRRRSSANELREASGTGGVADIGALRATVGEAAVKPVIVSPETTIRDTAIKMSERNLSSAIIVKVADEGQRSSRIVGIVTDATLRSEVLAKGWIRRAQ